MIEFSYPWMFVLIILPVFVTWLAPVYKERKSSLQVPYFAKLVDVTGEKPQSGAVILNRRHIQRFLVAIVWLCLVIAMAKPEIVGEPIVQKKSARDLMIAVDLSGSMAVEDFTTGDGKNVNRLVAVKQVLAEFANNREHDRLGLILFGDAPYLQAPFTADIQTWQTLLDESQIGMAGQSTAFGDAIGLAISVFKNTDSKSKVLIVLTDGNDNGSKVPPVEAAKVAAAQGVKIYTIAVGDPAAVGEEKVDIKVLAEIANVTKGKSFQALNRKELQQAYIDINDFEPQLFDSQTYRPRTSAHYYPIIVFTVLYLIILGGISVAKRNRARNKA
jgi:Ca-activated chloride channel family protein